MKDALFDIDTLARASFDDLDAERAAFWSMPPKPASLWEYSHTLTVPDEEDQQGRPKPYSPSSHPAQKLAIRRIDEGKDQHFTFVADTQDGKSWLVYLIAFHATIERGKKAVIALPNRNLGSDIWSGKMRRALIGSGQERFLPTDGAGSRSGVAPRIVQFRRVGGRGGGALIWMSGQGRKEAGQAALTAPDVFLDELDDWTPSAVQRIERRADKFAATGKARFFKASTVKSDSADESNILRDWRAGSRGRIAYRCPHCGGGTRLLFDRFDATAATLRAECCDGIIDDQLRARMLAGECWEHEERPDCGRYSLLWTSLDSPWKTLAWIAAQYQHADEERQHGNHAPMRQFYRDQRVEPYDGDLDSQNLTREHMAVRSARSSYDRGGLPDWCDRVVGSIDVQKDRIYWLILGACSKTGRMAISDWGEEYFALAPDGSPLRKREPSDEERDSTLDDVLARMREQGVERMDGEILTCSHVGIDIGYRSKTIGLWVTRRQVMAMRGDKQVKFNATRLGGSQQLGRLVRNYNGGLMTKRKMERRETGQPLFWWFVRSRDTRDRVRAGLLLSPEASGSIHLPAGVAASSRLVAHLTAWRLAQDDATGHAIWTQIGARDDLDDCLIYAWNIAQYAVSSGRMSAAMASEEADDTAATAPPASTQTIRPVLPMAPQGGGFGGFADW